MALHNSLQSEGNIQKDHENASRLWISAQGSSSRAGNERVCELDGGGQERYSSFLRERYKEEQLHGE